MAKSKYTEELAHQIVERMIDGESIRSICASPGMPSRVTVLKWVADDHEGFGKLYSAAYEARAHVMVEDAIEIADDARNDWMRRNAPDDEGWQFNGENVQRSRLRVDTRKWSAGKLHPRQYGDRNVTELTGPNGGPIAVHQQIVDSTPDIRLLLQQALDATEPKVIEAQAEPAPDRFPKDLGGRPIVP